MVKIFDGDERRVDRLFLRRDGTVDAILYRDVDSSGRVTQYVLHQVIAGEDHPAKSAIAAISAYYEERPTHELSELVVHQYYAPSYVARCSCGNTEEC